MKKDEVPQDESSLSKGNFKEVCYAVDANGNYTTVLSQGWEPKAIALDSHIEAIHQRMEEAKDLMRKGEEGPIRYFMELNRMDLMVLASYVGKWQWQVRRHFKRKHFEKLSDKALQKYADAFNISLEEFKHFRP